MKRRPFIVALLSMPFIRRNILAAEDGSETVKSAFQAGEKLTYSLGWQFLVAGHATLEVLPDGELNGEKIRMFRMTAETVRAIDPIYKVRDKLYASASYDVGHSIRYRKIQKEGKTRRDETVEFDWDTLQAHYTEAINGKKKTVSIQENTLDPLSAFYFIRNQPLKVGGVITGPLTDGKRCKTAQIKVVKREKIKVNGKKYDTFKLIPDLKDVGGVFKKSKNATMEIWCTADDRHIPVLLKSKVAVGSFRAELKP